MHYIERNVCVRANKGTHNTGAFPDSCALPPQKNTTTSIENIESTQEHDSCCRSIVPSRRGGEPGKSYRDLAVREGPDYVTYVFVFLGSIILCAPYKFNLSDQAQITLKLTISLTDQVQRFLAGQLGNTNFFYRGPNPLSTALHKTN